MPKEIRKAKIVEKGPSNTDRKKMQRVAYHAVHKRKIKIKNKPAHDHAARISS